MFACHVYQIGHQTQIQIDRDLHTIANYLPTKDTSIVISVLISCVGCIESDSLTLTLKLKGYLFMLLLISEWVHPHNFFFGSKKSNLIGPPSIVLEHVDTSPT